VATAMEKRNINQNRKWLKYASVRAL